MITAIKLFSGLILGISLAGCVTKDIVIAKSNSDGMGLYEASQESGLYLKGWTDFELNTLEEPNRLNHICLEKGYYFI